MWHTLWPSVNHLHKVVSRLFITKPGSWIDASWLTVATGNPIYIGYNASCNWKHLPAHKNLLFLHSWVRIPSANMVTRSWETGGKQLPLFISSEGLVTGPYLRQHQPQAFGFVKFCHNRPLSLYPWTRMVVLSIWTTCSSFSSLALKVAALVSWS